MQSFKYRIILVDGHVPFRNELCQLLTPYEEIEIIGEASDGKQALELVATHRPDVVILDVNMPNMNGIEATTAIKKWWTETEIVGLCVKQDVYITSMFLKAGAVAVISKDRLEDVHSTILRACMNKRARLAG